MRKQGGKSIICCFVGDKKFLKPNQGNEKDNLILIEGRKKLFRSFRGGKDPKTSDYLQQPS